MHARLLGLAARVGGLARLGDLRALFLLAVAALSVGVVPPLALAAVPPLLALALAPLAGPVCANHAWVMQGFLNSAHHQAQQKRGGGKQASSI
jgi:hypothetical protein